MQRLLRSRAPRSAGGRARVNRVRFSILIERAPPVDCARTPRAQQGEGRRPSGGISNCTDKCEILTRKGCPVTPTPPSQRDVDTVPFPLYRRELYKEPT